MNTVAQDSNNENTFDNNKFYEIKVTLNSNTGGGERIKRYCSRNYTFCVDEPYAKVCKDNGDVHKLITDGVGFGLFRDLIEKTIKGSNNFRNFLNEYFDGISTSNTFSIDGTLNIGDKYQLNMNIGIAIEEF